MSNHAAWSRALVLLCGLSLVTVGLLHADVADLVHVWWRSSTFNHCLLLPAIIAWLVVQRVPGLRQLSPEPWRLALLWLAFGALLWLAGAMASISMFRHAALIVMLQAIVMTVLGRAVSYALMFPLAYAFFLVPIGSELEPVLQLVTAWMAVGLLWVTGVPAVIEGIFITIPNGYFRVAEACSGTAFLIAMAAYATLVANLCFRGMKRRIGFILFSLLTCLLANGVRAFGIIYYAHLNGVASAVVVDHIVYGWLFFAIVILFVMLVGRRWFDRPADDPGFDVVRARAIMRGNCEGTGRVALIALLLVVLPFSWVHASRALSMPLPAHVGLPVVTGWSRTSEAGPYSWRPYFAGADHVLVGHYRDQAGHVVDLSLVFFSHQEDGKELVGFGQGAAGPDGIGDWTWSAPADAPPGARGEMLAGPGGILRRVVTFYVVGGTVTGASSGVKLATLKARLSGRDQRAMAVLVSARQEQGEAGALETAAALSAFLESLGPVQSLADRSLAID